MTNDLHNDGYVIVRSVFSPDQLEMLRKALKFNETPTASAGRRLFGVDWGRIQAAAIVPELRALVAQAFAGNDITQGKDITCLRATIFDKTADANWKVPWHQDLTIPVVAKYDMPGFEPWTVKDGIDHVQPPMVILEQILAARIHLDPCGLDNGCLRVLAGSHRHGRLDSGAIQQWRSRSEAMVDCVAESGDVLVMHPLLLHASSPAAKPVHRRVLHLEFAACELPKPLRWLRL